MSERNQGNVAVATKTSPLVTATWTDEQFGHFVRNQVTKTIVEKWHAGAALHAMQQRHKGDESWTAWLAAYFLYSPATAYRWIGIFTQNELADLEAGRVEKAVKLTGGGKKSGKKKAGAGKPKVTLSAILADDPDHREQLLTRALAKAKIKMSAVKLMRLLEALEGEWLAEMRAKEKEVLAVIGTGATG